MGGTLPAIEAVTGPCQTWSMVATTHASPFTYEDLKGMPDDGRRYELLDGALVATPSPGTAHQVCVGALFVLLREHRRPGDIVMIAPYDYVISEVTVLEPDVLVARREDLGTANLAATPLLVVEVISPGTRRLDRTAKRSAYEEAGVPAYWIVDPGGPAVTVLELVEERYQQVATVSGEESFTAALPFAVEITPARLLDDLA
jgi:Uma2 family endonuclease